MDYFLAAASIILFLWALICPVKPMLKQLGFFTGPGEYALVAPSCRLTRREHLTLILMFVSTRVAIYLAGYIANTVTGSMSGGFFETFYATWVKSDAPHYLGLAKNWYQTVGDPRFHIVFLPFYPIVLRFLGAITGEYFVTSILLSNACLYFACVYMVKLAKMDNVQKPMLPAWFMLIFPASFFFSAPFTESMFMLLSLACIYYARRRSFPLSCALGMLAAFTRSLGILLIVPVTMELLSDIPRPIKWRKLIVRCIPLLLIPLGLFAYILLNKLVTGDWFRFLYYQETHWYQRMGTFFNTVLYITDNIYNNVFDAAAALWLPELLAIFGALALMAYGARKLRPSYAAYSLCYFWVAISPTWLLSAPRYLMCMAPVYLVLAKACEKSKARTIILSAISILALAYLTVAYALGYPVY